VKSEDSLMHLKLNAPLFFETKWHMKKETTVNITRSIGFSFSLFSSSKSGKYFKLITRHKKKTHIFRRCIYARREGVCLPPDQHTTYLI